jgi:dTDP-4-amino-4,6-dideoxygalactose transaminase
MGAIRSVAAARGVPIVEDCAQAHGTECCVDGAWKRCGALGAAAAFSFYPTKNLGAYGDAGAVTTDDEGLAQALRMLRNYGEEKRYYHTVKGYNSRLDEMQAAVLRVKLRHLDAWNDARRERGALYLQAMKHLPIRLPHEAPWAKHIYHLFVIRSKRRDALQAFLRQENITTLLHYPVPVHLQEAYADLGLWEGSFPETEKACAEVLSLPMYAEMPLDHVKRVAEAVGRFHAN